MKHTCMVISVANIHTAIKFYGDLFGLEVYQDFNWLVHLPKESILRKSNNMEICFEEQDFDGFLNKLKKYTNIECLGEVVTHDWGQRVIRFFDSYYILVHGCYIFHKEIYRELEEKEDIIYHKRKAPERFRCLSCGSRRFIYSSAGRSRNCMADGW